MTNREKEKVKLLRERGYSYSKIAEALDVSENTIKAFCRRNNLGGIKGNAIKVKKEKSNICKKCEVTLSDNTKGPKKKFCSDECRRTWWKEHNECIDKKAYYKLVCEKCGVTFESYGNKSRKYCSHSCYIDMRFKGAGESVRGTI